MRLSVGSKNGERLLVDPEAMEEPELFPVEDDEAREEAEGSSR